MARVKLLIWLGICVALPILVDLIARSPVAASITAISAVLYAVIALRKPVSWWIAARDLVAVTGLIVGMVYLAHYLKILTSL